MKNSFNALTSIVFQKCLIRMLQQHKHLQNFTDQRHVYIFPKPISASIAKNLKIKKGYVQKAIKKQEAMNLIPAQTKAPISKTSTEPLKFAFKDYQNVNKSLKEKIDELQSERKKSSTKVSAELGDDMFTIMKGADHSRISPFKKLFWEEQQ